MANKPFAIQGADLTLGGVNLQAGTTGIVVPGVTQAVNYRVEEVNDQDGNNPDVFGSNANAVTVIDNAEYLYLVDDGDSPSTDYVAATYSVDELNDGEIEEISVDGSGVFLDADKTRAEAANMWATITPNPFASFNANNWTQIPFRPKMRAGEVENIGGGGNANTGDITFNDTTISTAEGDSITIRTTSDSDDDNRIVLSNNRVEIYAYNDHDDSWAEVFLNNEDTDAPYADMWVKSDSGSEKVWRFDHSGDLTLPAGGAINNTDGIKLVTDRGTLAIGTNMETPGMAGHFHIAFDGSNSNPPASDLFLGDDYNYVKLPGYELNPVDHGVEIGTNDRDGGSDHVWRFGTDGNLTFPDGTIQTTAYTGQSSGSGVLYIMANVDGDIVTSTDGVTWGTPIASGMSGISRVAVHNGVIVYIGGDGPAPQPGLYYSTVIGTVELCTGTDALEGDDIFWSQVRYFDEPNKWVAVGWIDGNPSHFPIVAHSVNGISWTKVPADLSFVAGFNTGDGNWRLTDIAYMAETGDFVISSSIEDSGAFGGIFITDNVTVPLDETVHIAIDLDVDHTAPWPVVQYGGPPGYMILFGTNDEVWYGYSTDVEDYGSLDGLGPFGWSDIVTDEIGYVPEISDIAYDATGFIAVTQDGQVIAAAADFGGPGVIVSIPLPYTVTDFAISRANPAVLTYTPPSSDTPDPNELHNGEKIVITGSDQFDGTYYYKASDDTLYTDKELTSALDSSGFDPFVSGGTLTMSQGTYFDAAGTSPFYYYIGNDDEQIFRSSNGITWTQQADVTGEYFNDFAYGTFGTVTNESASLTDDKEVKITVGNTEYWAIVNRANNADNGVESSAVAYDSDGNLVALHISNVVIGVDNDDNNIYRDRLIISKFDSSANLIWQKQIQEEMDDSQAHDVCIDDDDNIIVVFSQDGLPGADDTVSAIKYTSTGSELWKKDYHPAVVVTAVQEFDLDSDTITSGTFNGTTVDVVSLSGDEDSLGFRSGWSLQESTDDGSTWTTIEPVLGFGAYDDNTDTTPLYLEANSGVTLSSGYYYRVIRQGVNSYLELSSAVTNGTHTFIAAQYNENDGPGTGYDQGCIIKIDNSDGSLVWAKTFYIEETFNIDPYGMEIDASGNLVIVGAWFTPGPTAAFVSKFNGSTGAEIWTRILTTESYESTGGDVTADSQGNVFVSINAQVEIVHNQDDTYYKTAVYITKLNSLGVIQWTRRVGPGPCASIGTGIDCDATGNVYLSAITTAQKNPNREDNNFNDYDITDTRDVLAIAKYSTSGAVLWQRYVEANGYNFYQSRDAADGVGNFDYSANSGRNLAISTTGKIAVQATVRKYDLDNDVHDTRYWESITFQIDQDGRAMTIGSSDEKFVVKESRIPGKFVNLVDLEDSTTGGYAADVRVSTLTTDIEVTTPTITYADAELAQQIIKSAPYEYVFGNDGTLTIPNDGDIKLTQTQIGWFSIFGQVDDDNFNVQNRANCVDPATGDVYVTGQESANSRAFVARYNSVGELLWSIRLEDDDEGEGSRGNAIKMNPITGNVTVLAEYAGGVNSMVLEIDPDTAQIVNQLGFKDSVSGDESYANTEAYDFDFQSDGSIVAVGRKSDERRTYSVTPRTGSTTDVLVINRSDIGSDAYTSAWRISGTGFVGYNSISFNRYSGLTGTVRQGTGAEFNITDNEDGTYDATSIENAGTNYRVGHKIKVLGTDLGGVTPDNDCVITVDGVNNGQISLFSVAGMAAGSDAGDEFNIYTVTGTNFETGSGLTFDFWGPEQGTDYGNWEDYDVTNGGTNYADGDVVVIPGTQLGGTSPANDLTAIVTVTTGTVDGFDDFRGTGQNTTVRIEAGGSTVDFGGAGTWALSYDTGGEAFVWTNRLEGWTKVVGSLNPSANERYFSVATGSDGGIYAAGEIYTDDSTNDYQAVISKFNSSGVHQWSRALHTTGDASNSDGANAKCVAVRGTTVVVSHYDSYESETIITKLDTSGNILWQRRTESGDDSSVAIDTNGDIYAVAEAYFENKYNNLIKVIRFASNGEPIWRKFFSTLGLDLDGSNNEYFKNGRNLTLDAEHFYVSGYTTAFDSDAERAFLVKLPKSGDCDGYYGSWTVHTDAYDVLKVNATQANTFTPNIRQGNFESWTPDILSNWWDPSNNDSYQTLQPVVDRDGGAIEFADGTRQTSSAQQIPQLKISNVGQHRLCLDDMGKHIYVTNSQNIINVPYHYDNPLPIGFTVVIVNNSGGPIIIATDGGGIDIIVPGVDTSSYWELASPGMATLIKVEDELWFMTGNVTVTGP